MRISQLSTAAAVLCFWAATAQADPIQTPFSGKVRTVVGTFEFWGADIVGVCFESLDNPEAEPYGIWLSQGLLTESHTISLGDDHDTVVVMPSGASTTACETTFSSVDQNGHTLTFFMEGGNDTFTGGSTGVMKFDGGSGDDTFAVYSSYVQIWANSGQDTIRNYAAFPYANYFYGQTGGDCIQSRPGDYVHCGNEPYLIDKTTATSGSIGCEITGAYSCL